MVFAVILIKKQRRVREGLWRGRVGLLIHPFCCQISVKSVLNWLEYIQTKIFGAANHPRHPQNLDSLLHLDTKLDQIFKNNSLLLCSVLDISPTFAKKMQRINT